MHKNIAKSLNLKGEIVTTKHSQSSLKDQKIKSGGKVIAVNQSHRQNSKPYSFFAKIFKKFSSPKMIVLVVIIGYLLGSIIWKFCIETYVDLDVKIPKSDNKTFNQVLPVGFSANQIAIELEKADGKPILFYLYTTWCPACEKNYQFFNEIAREFQNTDLRVIAIAIDRNLTSEALISYLQKHGEIYFEPRFLLTKNGFIELLAKKNIAYRGNIPFTILFGRSGDLVLKYYGIKSKNRLRNKIIKELYPNLKN